jgi:hypothetical protein
MNVSWLIQLLQTPIVVYTIVLTIAWTLIQLSSKLSPREAGIRVGERSFLAILGAYVISALVVMLTNVDIFPFLHAAMFALTLWTVLSASSERSAPLLITTLIVALMPVVVMVSTKHPLPLGDDARFVGFAAAIEGDGRWIPFKYLENPYYQFFHLIPVVEHVLASVTGVGVKSIAGITTCYLTLKLTLYLTYFALLFLVVRRLVDGAPSSLVAVLLLSITPPLALSQVVHQGYAIVLSLATLLVMLRWREGGSRADAIAKYPLWVSGVVAHATYTIMVLAFALPMIIESKRGARRIAEAIEIMLVISLAYWIYTYVMDLIVRPTVNAFDRLVDLITGRVPPFYGTAQPWYGPEQQTFFVAWALIPSMVISYYFLLLILVAFPKMVFHATSSTKRGSSKESPNEGYEAKASFRTYTGALSFLGLGGTAINFMLRTLPTFGGRYFYWLYLLMLPSSVILMTKTSRKILGLFLSIILISIVAFYGVRDPTIMANTYGNYIEWADRKSWDISRDISAFLDTSLSIRADARLATPLSVIIPNGFNSTGFNVKPHMLLIGIDRIGFSQISLEPNVLRLIDINHSNVVFASLIYRGFC